MATLQKALLIAIDLFAQTRGDGFALLTQPFRTSAVARRAARHVSIRPGGIADMTSDTLVSF